MFTDNRKNTIFIHFNFKTNIMKRLLLVSTIAILGFASCKKESLTKEVTFTVGCKACYVKINKDNQTFLVKDYYTRTVQMNKNDTAYVFAGISSTTGVKMRIDAKVRINGTTVAEKTVDEFGPILELKTPVN